MLADERAAITAMRAAADHLGAALAQVVPGDDAIIVQHIRDAHRILLDADHALTTAVADA